MNNISVDERDLYNYLWIELYIKERNYLLYPKEYLLLKTKCELLGAKSIYNKGDFDGATKELVDGIAVFVFETPEYKSFHCWANVLKKDLENIRKRNMKWDVSSIVDQENIENYVEERNFLLNGVENFLLQQKARQFPLLGIKYHGGEIPNDLKNQSIGMMHYYFQDGRNVWYSISSFEEKMLERKRG